MSSKEILTILGRLDVPVANHMSVMDEEMVSKVENFFTDIKKRAAERHAQEVEKEMRERQLRRQEERQDTNKNTTATSTPAQSHGDREQNVERVSAEPQASANRSAAREPSAREEDRTQAPRRDDGVRSGDQTRAASAPIRSYQGDARRSDEHRPSSARPVNGDGARANDGRPRTASGAPRQGQTGGPGNRDARSSGGYQGNRDGGGYNNRGGQGGQSGGYGNRSGQGGGYQGSRDGGQRTGQSGYGNRGGQSGGYQGNRDGGGYNNRGGQGGQGGGYGNRSGQGGGYGNRGGQGGQGGGFANRGGQSGGRPAGGGSRPASGIAAAAAKPTAPGSLRKDKEKKDRQGFARHEEFNETKLQRAKRRNGGRGQAKPLPTEVTVEGPLTVGDFAKLLQREAAEVIKKLLLLGIMATINQEIDTDTMELIGSEFGVTVHVVEPVDEEALDMLVEEDAPESLVPRPPVVTIMGHVDHGKTTLLDAIRESRVTASESGGITQHIGAYQVEVNDREITFLDTPGHEAFTTMRARGAQVTDITILVVAADDGVMPQTVEAINHAKAAKVPIIVAVNKIDKPDANPDRVKQELAQYELVPEDWGGDTIFVHISALKRIGLEELLEMVLLVADVQELKANPQGRPRGTVIEAKLDKGRGPVATVLVQNGTLKVGDIVVAGTTYGRVRAMLNDTGKRLKAAGPSTPVEIQGLGGVPSAGDQFVVYDDERSARNLVEKRSSREKQEQMQTTSRVTLDDLYRQIQEGNVAELNVIVKADVQGSVEALVQSIEKIDVEGVRVRVIHKGAGAITESDVSLASASNAIIIGFHVRPDVNAKRMAEQEKVDIRLYRVIYNVMSELESAMKGMLAPEYKEVVLGHAEVRETFNISRIGTVAGCYVTDGKMTRDAEARLIRDGIVVYEGKLDSLKRFKDDAREVATGFECGITLEKYNDIKVGDVVEAFTMEAVQRA
ncbi:translation initiation factor IF-2 [Alicyclobacillus acidiphilus]|uniref:translation initiation factor IF-2 n=1 Tax=Alicyclobacillus acidiphilus TaxID=182455 RepID=UPI002480D759|nr:translation initiation factor IF-2 [Alicyclobacillus acidiphilus]